MARIEILKEKLDRATMEELTRLCPFNAMSIEEGELVIGAGCRMCRLCCKKSDAVRYIESEDSFDRSAWSGVAVFAERHPVTYELLSKARELAAVTGQQVYALVIGQNCGEFASELCRRGADRVYVYDHPELRDFSVLPYAAAFCDFAKRVRPSSVLVGATRLGRSLAPRVAARLKTGLTADCTSLEMRESSDLVQIRPAFGGNIMAQIVTKRSRPQFCTVRYRIFSASASDTRGELVKMEYPGCNGGSEVLSVSPKPAVEDIADADMIVAVGRGLKSKADLPMIEELAELLHAKLACTRPLIEAGWFDYRHQIGLSGRAVKPRLIVTCGISGSVQFAAGMKNSDRIIAINSDPDAGIFNIAHTGVVGDIYEVVPALCARLKEGANV